MSEADDSDTLIRGTKLTSQQETVLRLAIGFYRDAFVAGFLRDPGGVLTSLSEMQVLFIKPT